MKNWILEGKVDLQEDVPCNVPVNRINKKGIRHPLTVGSLKSILQCSDDEIFQVIEKFRTPSRSFLTPVFTIPLDEKSVIDFSTERLIGMWNRLKDWFDEELVKCQDVQAALRDIRDVPEGKGNLIKRS